MTSRASARALSVAGAASFVLLVALSLAGLAHPSELYGPGGDPCAPPGLRDAIAYAVLAGFATAAGLAAWALLTRSAPAWLAGLGVLVLVTTLATKHSSNFGCLRDEVSLSASQGHPRIAVGLALLAGMGVLLAWRRLLRSPGEGQR